MKKLLLALALFLVPAAASAQCNGVFTNNTVCGNATGSSNLPRPTNPAAFQGSAGGIAGQIQYNNSGVLGGFTMSGDVATNTSTGVATIQPGVVTNSKLATGAANTVKGSINGTTTSDLAIASCSAIYSVTQWLSGTGWQCGINPVLPSRTIAATLNLAAFTSVSTLGYTTAGDGGGANFVNVGSTPFQDTGILTGTLSAAGTTYTNGTYRGVALSGGTGTGAVATIVVAGTVVSSVTITGTGGNGYTAGDVLTTSATNIGGTGSGFTWTVSTVSTARGSFTDTASTHWQIVADPSGANIRQFGAVQNWTGTDGSATNDYAAIQAALYFAGRISGPTADAGGVSGATVIVPRGASLICGNTSTLLIPGSTILRGQGVNNSVLKLCDSGQDAGTHVITLCDPETQKACFAAKITELTLYATATPSSNSNIAMIYTNNAQQLDSIYRVAVYPGLRSCARFETGYGGAAYIGINNLFCTPASTSGNPGIFINYGTTLIAVRDAIVESGGSGATLNGIQITGGFVIVDNYHSEGISTGMFINISTSNANGIVTVRNASGGSNCSSLITKQNASAANSLIMSSIVGNGCTNTYTANGAGSGAIVVAGQTIP